MSSRDRAASCAGWAAGMDGRRGTTRRGEIEQVASRPYGREAHHHHHRLACVRRRPKHCLFQSHSWIRTRSAASHAGQGAATGKQPQVTGTMFRAANPYDELVAQATDENLTSENWDLSLRICERVSSAQDPGGAARQVVDALCRRLAAAVNRSANVQLLCLSLADALGKNVPPDTIYPELSSRAWCALLLRMVHDRAGVHDTVRTRLLALIRAWAHAMRASAADAAGNGTGAIMQETYNQLKAERTSDLSLLPAPPWLHLRLRLAFARQRRNEATTTD